MGGGSDSVDVCGGTIGFERRGHGPPLVLVHAQIPGSTFVVIPGPGHMVNLEAPGRFNDEVRSFLTRSAS